MSAHVLDAVNVSRTYGISAVCSCGWSSLDCDNLNDTADEFDYHVNGPAATA